MCGRLVDPTHKSLLSSLPRHKVIHCRGAVHPFANRCCSDHTWTRHHVSNQSLVVQWGHSEASSADCLHDDRVEDKDGEGGFSVGCACSALASNDLVMMQQFAIQAHVQAACKCD